MYCKRCGNKVEEIWKYCPKCKLPLIKKNIEFSKENMIKKQKQDKRDSIICIVIFLLGIFGIFFLNNYSIICFSISLISIVTGFIKYPNNIFIKILFLIFLICVILFGIIIIILFFTIVNFILTCNGFSAG